MRKCARTWKICNKRSSIKIFNLICHDGNLLPHLVTLTQLDEQGIAESYDVVIGFLRFQHRQQNLLSERGRAAGRNFKRSRYRLRAYSTGEGIPSTRPSRIFLNSSSISSCTKLLLASTSLLEISKAPPLKSVTLPPASCTRRTPAAVSQELRLNSQKASYRPAAV